MVDYAYGGIIAPSFMFCIWAMSEFQLISPTIFSKYEFISNVNKMFLWKKRELVLSYASVNYPALVVYTNMCNGTYYLLIMTLTEFSCPLNHFLTLRSLFEESQ